MLFFNFQINFDLELKWVVSDDIFDGMEVQKITLMMASADILRDVSELPPNRNNLGN
jgi:hypothetical protein